ncbi:hypothetical protein [Myxococcus landrumensis]|uniref:Lipoprotein n=1 Tax=Myxococcus landrumensis TaxID=2813577 RepID=A0ABX7N9G7_9BACT|nr:hypothetical protein [Myxococcus landrumus]QSQ15425.1 hypothetical protein JY572_04930 [Myxococcus landrumus]
MRVPAWMVAWLWLGCGDSAPAPGDIAPSPSALSHEEDSREEKFGRARRFTNLTQLPEQDWPRPSHLVDFHGDLYFAVDYRAGAPEGELWASDGSTRTTRRIQSFPPPDAVFNGIDVAQVLGDKLYLTINHTEMYGEAWVSDGTTPGTVRLVDFPEPFGNSVTPVTPIRNRVYFIRSLQPSPFDPGLSELWSSDGSRQGTRRVVTLSEQSYGATPRCQASVGDWMFFGLSDATSGNEPWISDGTPEGTHLLQDLNPGPAGSTPCMGGSPPRAMKDEVYFTRSRDGEPELWATDGTAAGTHKVLDAPSKPLQIVKHDLYVVQHQPEGLALWKVRIRDGQDGTPAHAVTIPSAPGARFPPSVVSSLAVGGRLYLMLRVNGAEEGEPNGQLWVTDGSPRGTRRLHDTVTVQDNAAPLIERYDLLASGHHVLFGCHAAGKGRELCVTDGTPRGTGLLQDLAPGARSSSPHEFVCAGQNIYFVAHDDERGYELWKLRPHADLHPSTSCVTPHQGQQ